MNAARRLERPDAAMLSDDALDRIRSSLDVVHDLISLGRDETDDDRIQIALDKAEAAIERACAFVAEAIGAVHDGQQDVGGATAMQLRRAFEGGFAAGGDGRRGNPFEDPLGSDWPGRRAHAAAWNRGLDEWHARYVVGADALSGSPVRELNMAGSREELDHRRRMLAHQERVAAERRAAIAEPMEPQMRIPLIGEVRRPEPTPPKRRRPRGNKPVQPRLGDG